MGKVRGRFSKRERVVTPVEGKTMAQQHMKEDADINVIVERAKRGIPMPQTKRVLRYGDMTSASYHEMVNQVMDIDEQFSDLPARIRSRFRNDPYQLIRWLEDKRNHPEAAKLGLLEVPQGYAMKEDGTLWTTDEANRFAAEKAKADRRKAVQEDLVDQAERAAKSSGGLPNGDK